MKITIPVTIEVGLAGEAEAIQHIHESMQNAAHENWAPLALVQAWPVLRDLATITAATAYATDDPSAAVGALVDAIGLDAVAQVVRHRQALEADATVARVVRDAVARESYEPGEVPVAVVFDTMDYDNGAFLYDGSATVFFANGDDDSIDFNDADARTLNDALNLDGPCASGARVLVNVGNGHVERYESNEHDVMAAELDAWVKRANALA